VQDGGALASGWLLGYTASGMSVTPSIKVTAEALCDGPLACGKTAGRVAGEKGCHYIKGIHSMLQHCAAN